MSLVQHFDHQPIAGFARPRTAPQASRQFQVSLALVIILAIAAVSVSLSLWLGNGNHTDILAHLASI